MKYYTRDHEWVEIREGVAYVGISDHAASELGDITFVELPEAGTELSAGDSLGVIESVKAASDIYAPISGKVTAANPELEEKPELVNASAEDQAWLCRLEPSNPEELKTLMDETAYAAYLAQ